MLEFKEIELSDKNLIDSYFKKLHPKASEYTFTNIFMWSSYYGFTYIEIDGWLCIVGFPESKNPFVFSPVGNGDSMCFQSAVTKLNEYFISINQKISFIRVSEEDKLNFENLKGFETEIIHDLNNGDYVYKSYDLIKLSGKKYDGKRNHIHRFKRENEFTYKKIDDSNIYQCHEIMEKWFASRDGDYENSFYFEMLANKKLLKNYNNLDCIGAIIEVNGIAEGFSVGEMLNDNTAVIHIEKANGKIHGLYPLLNQQFCENQWGEAEFINREQDLGIEGLRKAKLSYHPVKMINKFIVNIK
jgi:hypothetical protein